MVYVYSTPNNYTVKNATSCQMKQMKEEQNSSIWRVKV